MSTADHYISGRFTSTPENHFYADGIVFECYADDGEFSYFEFADGSRCKINGEGEIYTV